MFQEQREYFRLQIVQINNEFEMNPFSKKFVMIHSLNYKISFEIDSKMEIWKKQLWNFMSLKKEQI